MGATAHEIKLSKKEELTMTMAAINPPSTPDAVAHYVESGIRNGEFAAGEKIKEQYLVDKLNVSRGTVREALIKLQELRVVEKRPRKGCFVAQSDPNDALAALALLKPILALSLNAMDKRAKQALGSRLSSYLSQSRKATTSDVHGQRILLYNAIIDYSDNYLSKQIAIPVINTLKNLPTDEVWISPSEVFSSRIEFTKAITLLKLNSDDIDGFISEIVDNHRAAVEG